jgi:hypothetical protein
MLQQPTIIRPRNSKNSSKYIHILSILLFLLYLISNSSSALWPNCNFQCNAGDVTVKDVWLGDSNGNSLPPCSPGSQSNVYIWARLENNANTPRYAVILLADIYINGVLQKSFYDQGICVLESFPPKAVRSIPVYNLSWSCVQQIRLKRFVLSWETAHGTGCVNARRTCSNRNTKCFGGPGIEIPVGLPLAADFAANDTRCCCEEISFLDRTAGGLRPYAYSWDFGDGSSKSSLQNPLHRFDKPGQYIITLEANDSKGSFARTAKKVSIFPKPFAKAGPNQSIRPGEAIRLEGSVIEGTPPYSCVWSPDDCLDDPFSIKPMALPKKTTVYNLCVEDAQGCRSSDNMTLFISSVNITKSILKNPVEKGKEATYNYRIKNQGDSDLKNIKVIDSIFGQVFGPFQGDENGDGRLSVGEAWIYQMVFRPLANATSGAKVYAVDPAGATLSAESNEIEVDVISSPQPLQCQILGLNIVCEDVTAEYAPRIKGEDPAGFNLTWKIDGSEIGEMSNDGGIEVHWARYGGGYHVLQLTADRICKDAKECEEEDGKIDRTGFCEMKVLVVEVPSATIEMDSD